MKKTIVLLAAFALLVLVGCTPKKPVTGLYADPVEPIVTPIHVEYGPGSRVATYTSVTKLNGKTMTESFSVDEEVQRLGANLVSTTRLKDARSRKGSVDTYVDGTFLTITIEFETDGKPVNQQFSSEALDEKELEQLKQAVGKIVGTNQLINQDVATGDVLFSAQDILEKEMAGSGATLDGVKLEFVLAGYVMHKGEKVLLVKCEHPYGKIRKAGAPEADFGLVSYMFLQPENLLVLYSEAVVTVSIPGILELTVSETNKKI